MALKHKEAFSLCAANRTKSGSLSLAAMALKHKEAFGLFVEKREVSQNVTLP